MLAFAHRSAEMGSHQGLCASSVPRADRLEQERVLGVAYFANQYGPALVDKLMAELPTDMGSHWVVTL